MAIPDEEENSTLAPAGVSETETITLNIVHNFPEDSRLVFSDNMAVQHTPSEFIITFAQTRQPIIHDASQFDNMKEIRADVVARIVLTPPKMVELITALRDNWGMYQRRMKALMESRANASEPKQEPSTS